MNEDFNIFETHIPETKESGRSEHGIFGKQLLLRIKEAIEAEPEELQLSRNPFFHSLHNQVQEQSMDSNKPRMPKTWRKKRSSTFGICVSSLRVFSELGH
jgi:hypothetical protein